MGHCLYYFWDSFFCIPFNLSQHEMTKFSALGPSRGAGKARFNVATPTNVTVTCTAYVLPYNLQTKSI